MGNLNATSVVAMGILLGSFLQKVKEKERARLLMEKVSRKAKVKTKERARAAWSVGHVRNQDIGQQTVPLTRHWAM